MGALLSLPLLAVPSMGTVSHPRLLWNSALLKVCAGSILCSKLLRRRDLLDGVQRMRKMRKQVGNPMVRLAIPRGSAHIPSFSQCRNSYRLCSSTSRQLNTIVDHAHEVGHRETPTSHARLR
jgi:hypothetical protein